MGIIGKSFFGLLARGSTFRLQTRFAGHAKWQNIRHTKQANDVMKSRLVSRYCVMVRRAVIQGGRQPDPKINTKLGDVMAEAFRVNVPKATLERAIERAMKVNIVEKLVEIQGPGGCAVVCKCETENISTLRRDIKKALKKFDATLVPEGKLINMFHEKGQIRAKGTKKTGEEIDADTAEDAAIEAGAEEVTIENYGENDDDSTNSKILLFTTEASELFSCKSRLESRDFDIVSADIEIKPYRKVDFGEKVYNELQELIKILSEMSEVLDISHNVIDKADVN